MGSYVKIVGARPGDSAPYPPYFTLPAEEAPATRFLDNLKSGCSPEAQVYSFKRGSMASRMPSPKRL
jgi:hypothetical protein